MAQAPRVASQQRLVQFSHEGEARIGDVDAAQIPVTIIDLPYDRELTRLLAESLLAHRNALGILFNDSQIVGVPS